MTKETYLTESLPRLLRILRDSDVRELQLEEGDIRLRIHRASEVLLDSARDLGPTVDRPTSDLPTSVLVRAPVVGTFYRAGKPGMAPLVSEGSYVQDSTVIGIVEALQVLTDVEAACIGTVTAVLATDGQPVEYNQPLLEIQLDG